MPIYLIENSDTAICCSGDSDIITALELFHLDDYFSNSTATKGIVDMPFGSLHSDTRSRLREFLHIPKKVKLVIPLPFWYSRDRGLALPMAAIPYQSIAITINFANISEIVQAN